MQNLKERPLDHGHVPLGAGLIDAGLLKRVLKNDPAAEHMTNVRRPLDFRFSDH